jgi:Fe-S cluster assembly protein SufD
VIISGKELFHNPLPKGVKILTETLTEESSFWNRLARNGSSCTIEVSEDAELSLLVSRHAAKVSEATLGEVRVVIKAGVKCDLIQTFEGLELGLTHLKTKIELDERARMDHVVIIREGTQALNYNHYHAKLANQALLHQTFLTHGGKLVRTETLSELNGEGAHLSQFSLSYLKTDSVQDMHSSIVHNAASTTANQLAKNLLDDSSKAIFTGRIKIARNAQQVHSAQLNRNLLKSPKAHAIGQPQLEIFADDVKCNHGSTTGKIGDEEMFYLLSRGIPAARATELLTHAFVEEVFANTLNSKFKSYLQLKFKELA